ncbi:hypothetical protein GCM10022247_56590 [Allokutzneria multivorans]|uniref:Uncharacterized protein n=1 Tax=Allokutzneria multivorans TaxID=1142134 RepID=A0ABP7TEQ7_9PSEU
MPLSSAVRQRCRAFLPQNEALHYLFPAMASADRYGGSFGVIVAVTEGKVVVLACSPFSHDRPESVWAEHPRATELGPVESGSGPMITLGDLALEFDDEYVAVVCAADAELSGDYAMPPDPLPDL